MKRRRGGAGRRQRAESDRHPGGVHGVARWISKLGIMSRSDAERRVVAGRVTLNDRVVRDPDHPCHPERDRITVDGRPVRPARKVYFALNKPVGCITTARDPEGRPTAYDLLPPGTEGAQAVGRLDADTEGLLLFTNDTEFAARVSDGKSGVEKEYEAVLEGRPDRSALRRFERGIVLEGTMTRPARAAVLEEGDGFTRVRVVITEGKNRQVRRMWEALGHPVRTLRRTRIGPILLGGLPSGRTRRVREDERALIAAAGESP
jgi:23S rRNA pseudouridine2605 synthase